MTDAYLAATRTRRAELVGRGLFEVFPDGSADATAPGARALRASLERVLRTRVAETMPLRRGAAPDATADDDGGDDDAAARWQPVNTPVLDAAGEVVGLVHCVAAVTARGAPAAAHAPTGDAQLYTLFDAMPQLGWAAQPDGFIDFYNRGWYAYTGMTPAEMQHAERRSVHRPDFLEAVLARWQASLRIGAPFEMEFPLRRHDGVFRWFLTRVTPLRDAHGRVVRWVGINTDIQAQKEVSTQSEEKFRLLVQSVEDYAILMLDADGRVASWNKGAARIQGYAADEILGEPLARFYPPDAVAAGAPARGLAVAAQTGRFEDEGWRVRKDGSQFWASTVLTALHGEDGTLRGFAKVTRDHSARKALADEAERRRQIQDERDRLFELSTDLIGVAGLDGYFQRLNPSWTRTLGWTAAEIVARPWLDFVHPEDVDATVAAGAQLGAGAPIMNFQNRYRAKSGAYRWLDWRCVPMVADGLIYAIARDVTDARAARALQEQSQQQLILADRLASVGTLAAGMAHEINNPLAYVTTNVDLALEEVRALAGGSPSARMKDLEELLVETRQGAERIGKIVRGLKTFSRVDDERRSVVDLKASIELSVNMAFTEIRHRARLVKDYGPVPHVNADDARLSQVFINLLVNAAQALPDGHSDAHEIRIVTATDAQGRAVIEIRDTGPGIPAAVLPRIFEPFFTTKAVGVGTGLGLSICHNIVTGMGGELVVASTLGRGTTFRVVLPAAAAPPPGPDPTAPATGPAPRRAVILVVDDEPAVGIALGRVLREHDVTVVATADAALALLAEGRRFDVIFSDLMMPQMTGMDLYDALATRSPGDAARMVFVSGGAFTPDARAFLERVANERLDKPFRPADVRALVERFLR